MKNDLLIKMNELQNKLISKQTPDSFLNDFKNFQKDFDNIFFLTDIFKQSLVFLQIMYEVSNIRKHLKKISPGLLNRILELKVKDIISNGSTNLTLKEWIEEYFDTLIYEKDFQYINFKIQNISKECPSIITLSDREFIISNIIIKHSQRAQLDDITKRSILTKSVSLLLQYPESVTIDKATQVFSDMGEIKEIIHIAARKAVYLKTLIDSDNFVDRSEETRRLKTEYYNEFKECLYYIFKILSEIGSMIKSWGTKYKSDAPQNIQAIFTKNKFTLEELVNLQTVCINEVLAVEEEFLHDLLYDHLNELDMLGLLNQFKSPFLEKYLKKMIDIDRKDPKKFQSLFKLQFSMKDYSKAFHTVLNLINFVNHDMLNKKDYVKILDRKSYCNSALICLEHLLQRKDDNLLHEYLQNKTSITEIKNILTIQNSLYDRLVNETKIVKDIIEMKVPLENAIFYLEAKLVSVYDLYSLAREFKQYDIMIDIFFLMYKLKDKNTFISLPLEEINLAYENHINFLIKSGKKYPFSLIEFLNKIFVENLNDIMDKESVFSKLIPMNFLINILEKKNKFFEQIDCDYENATSLTYDSLGNPFWFVHYLKFKLQLNYNKIFKFYDDLYREYSNFLAEKSSEEIHILTTNLILCMMCIIKLWCYSIEDQYHIYLKQRDTTTTESFNEDVKEFDRKKLYLSEFMKKSYEFTMSRNLKYLITPQNLAKIRNFQKIVENKLESLINKILSNSSLGEIENLDLSVSKNNLVKSVHNHSMSIRDEMTSIGNILEEENKNESFLKLVKSEKKHDSYKRSNLEEEV